jgi:hypothetical protein
MGNRITVAVSVSSSVDDLKLTLASLLVAANGRELETLVIAGDEPIDAALAAAGGDVRLLRYSSDVTPGARLNDAIVKARGDAIAFVPAGAVPERHWMTAVDAALAKPDVAGVVPRVLDGTGTRVRACGTGVKNGRLALARADAARDAKYVLRPTPLDLAPICGLVVRKAHVARVHGFDAAFERSLFDYDWTLRARVEGLTIAYRPDYALRYDGPLLFGQTAAERSSAEHFLQRWQTVFKPNLVAEVFVP